MAEASWVFKFCARLYYGYWEECSFFKRRFVPVKTKASVFKGRLLDSPLIEDNFKMMGELTSLTYGPSADAFNQALNGRNAF